MKSIRRVFLISLTGFALALTGCSSSDESASRQRTAPSDSPAAVPASKPAEQPAKADVKPAAADTVNAMVQKTDRPIYEPKSQAASPSPVQSSLPTGRYTVQLGAYKMPDNAERVASLAKDRFQTNVYTSFDKTDSLYKVMLGDFASKDDARSFRDRMVQQFPADYKDAWVSESPAR